MADPKPSAYKVLPEKCIRLLRVEDTCLVDVAHSKAKDLAITCSLEVVSLDSTPEYTALSYVWGSTERLHPVLCDGVEIIVRSNLFAALRQFCFGPHQAAGPFWIDQLCISQDDEAEKGSQVALMGRIYSSAQDVLIWLGDVESGVPDEEIHLWRQLEKTPLLGNDDYTRTEDEFITRFPELKNSSAAAQGQTLQWPKRFAKHIEAFNWLKRMWTLQEIVLARQSHVQFGSYRLPWRLITEICDFSAQLVGKYTYDRSAVMDIAAARQRIADNGGQPCEQFAQMLTVHPDRQATDPRDRYFALLSLCKPGLGLVPSYQKSLQQTCHDITVAIALETRDLRFLGVILTTVRNSKVPELKIVDSQLFDSSFGSGYQPSFAPKERPWAHGTSLVPDWSQMAYSSHLQALKAITWPSEAPFHFKRVKGCIEIGGAFLGRCFTYTRPENAEPWVRKGRIQYLNVMPVYLDGDVAESSMAKVAIDTCAVQLPEDAEFLDSETLLAKTGQGSQEIMPKGWHKESEGLLCLLFGYDGPIVLRPSRRKAPEYDGVHFAITEFVKRKSTIAWTPTLPGILTKFMFY